MREIGTVVSEGLNLRTFPHYTARPITELERGTRLQILETRKTEKDGTWARGRVIEWKRDVVPDGEVAGWVKIKTAQDGVLLEIEAEPDLPKPVEPPPPPDWDGRIARTMPRWVMAIVAVGVLALAVGLYLLRQPYLVP